MAREIIHAGLADDTFIERGTSGFDAYRAAVEPYTLEFAAAATGIPADVIRDSAHQYAKADRAMICWTLGITEHHNAVDNVVALINLALLTGHVGRYGCGCNPLRGQNNVQGGGDMGALPNKLPGFQDVTIPEHREKFEKAWGRDIIPTDGWNLTEMMHAMDRKEMTGSTSSARIRRSPTPTCITSRRSSRVSTISSCRRSSSRRRRRWRTWCSRRRQRGPKGKGTVTNSERRVQRVRKAVEPPGEARDEIWIMSALAERMGRSWGYPTAEDVWNEVRALSPQLAGMSYARLEALGGLQWPCPDESHPGTKFLHARLWDEDPAKRGRLAPFSLVHHEGPVEQPNEDYPLVLTTGRRLESYNTGVQSGGYDSPLASRRVARHLARRRRPAWHRARRHGARDVAPRHGRRAGVHRSLAAGRRRVHDAAFPRRDRDELPHDQRDRPAVGHGRVQGVRGSCRAGADRASFGMRRAEPLAAAGDD